MDQTKLIVAGVLAVAFVLYNFVWPKLKPKITEKLGGLTSAGPTQRTRSEAFEALEVALEFFEQSGCHEGADFVRHAAPHLFHEHKADAAPAAVINQTLPTP